MATTQQVFSELVFPVSRLFEVRVKEYLDRTHGKGNWSTRTLALEITLAHSYLLCQGDEPEFVKWFRRTEPRRLKKEPAWIKLRGRRKDGGRSESA
jgi:hypothetical protein